MINCSHYYNINCLYIVSLERGVGTGVAHLLPPSAVSQGGKPVLSFNRFTSFNNRAIHLLLFVLSLGARSVAIIIVLLCLLILLCGGS